MREEEYLRQVIEECCNDVLFTYKGKMAGVMSEVHDYMPTYQVWYGDNTKEYSDLNTLFMDKFYDGMSLKDLIGEVEFTFA